MWLRNLSIIGTVGLQQIQVEKGKIKMVTDYEKPPDPHSGEMVVEFDNAIAFPGLINSHDHLDFNLFPPAGNRIYHNYAEWGKDIHRHNKESINGVLKIPQQLRIQWGLYKNLLNGMTTVVNHGPRIDIPDPFISILQDQYSLHSIRFENNWKFKLNQFPTKRIPYVIHVGEGTDKPSHEEIDSLIRWNLFKRPLITVHGVAMDAIQAENFDGLVWCPASNYFLLDKTADIRKLKTKTTILFGTDSTLTAHWNVWEHLRMARKTQMLTDTELFETLTKNPQRMWRQGISGSVTENNHADVVIARNGGRSGFEAFYGLNPEDILLVLHRGDIRLFDEEIKDQLSVDQIPLKRFSKILLNGRCKYLYGDPASLLTEVKRYYPEAVFPIRIFKN